MKQTNFNEKYCLHIFLVQIGSILNLFCKAYREFSFVEELRILLFCSWEFPLSQTLVLSMVEFFLTENSYWDEPGSWAFCSEPSAPWRVPAGSLCLGFCSLLDSHCMPVVVAHPLHSVLVTSPAFSLSLGFITSYFKSRWWWSFLMDTCMKRLCFLEYADGYLLGLGVGRVGTILKCVCICLTWKYAMF